MSMAAAGMTHPSHRLTVRLATTEADLRAAQRLRYRVFIEEMGGSGELVDHAARLERDRFDAVFDHLLLIDAARDPAELDHVVGAYRLLPDTRLAQAGRFYCDDEFDLTPLRRSGRRLLELGRSCMDPAYRGGTGMLQLWQGLAQYVIAHDIEILFGAASFHGTDPQHWAQSLGWLHHHHLAPNGLRACARQKNGFVPIAPELLDRRVALSQMPSLIRAYLRLGGVVGEGVFVDPAFRTTDVCIILDTAVMSAQARAFATRVSAEGPPE
ncbi:putative hemolysin [Roseinatronobacter thiooxidans]|uniref:L-ornithine N(alpha)-acyltransferase n=2 Tax=Roseinatronobacter thiooxidans TaxID=121821 RepID=A0A2W7QDF9_9RHOB|nr:putative hemolysin [Roseinatronobacter thiooxidans]